MEHTKTAFKLVALAFFGLLMLASNVYSQKEKAEHLLDSTSFNFHYQTGSGLNVSFEGGLARYEWIAGPRKGNKAQDISYRSRKIGDEMYLVNWDQSDKPDFITMIFDFNKNLMHSSSLIGYGTERQRIVFLAGILEHVKRQ